MQERSNGLNTFKRITDLLETTNDLLPTSRMAKCSKRPNFSRFPAFSHHGKVVGIAVQMRKVTKSLDYSVYIFWLLAENFWVGPRICCVLRTWHLLTSVSCKITRRPCIILLTKHEINGTCVFCKYFALSCYDKVKGYPFCFFQCYKTKKG